MGLCLSHKEGISYLHVTYSSVQVALNCVVTVRPNAACDIKQGKSIPLEMTKALYSAQHSMFHAQRFTANGGASTPMAWLVTAD